MEYTDRYIKELFESCKTQSEVIEKLGYKKNGSGWRLVRKLAKQISLNLNVYGRNATFLTKEKYNENPKVCKCCGKELTYEQRGNNFCSHSCSAKINNLNRKHNTNTKRKISETLQLRNQKNNGLIKDYNEKTINKICLNCGKILTEAQKYNKFCSHRCSTDYHYNELIKRWLNGENFTKGGHQIPSFIKKYLLNIHNSKCEKCGWGEEHPITHTVPLEVHHIDGDCTNNHIENLQLLCPNCHSLTENFGSLNKNSKRFHRKKSNVKKTK